MRLSTTTWKAAAVAVVLTWLPLAAQTVVGGGYQLPTGLHVAPGQVVTVFVAGDESAPVEPVSADETPLPVELGGVSVEIRSTGNPPIAAPLFAVTPVPTCEPGFAVPCTGETLLAITLQIPYEVEPGSDADSPFAGSEAVLSVVTASGTTRDFRLIPRVDRIHFLNSCDGAMPFAYRDTVCRPIVVHADGSLVTDLNPAQAGETIVLFGFGLGRGETPATTGAVVAEPIRVPEPDRRLHVRFDFAANAEPSRPLETTAFAQSVFPALAYAGLTPGAVGLYQVNVRIPQSPDTALPCGDVVESNLTISVGGGASFDGVRICAATAGTDP